MRRFKHNLSHYRLTTLNQGQLYPIACVEVLPGDAFRHSTSVLMRVTPLVAPVMHPVHVYVQHWYVPNRLVWENWEDFITDASGSSTIPTISATTANAASSALIQSMGVGIGSTARDVNALPFRAYNLIWNEFYRDQDLSTALTVDVSDTDDEANYAIQNVMWEKDYFTTARANPQQGADTEVATLDLNLGTAPVTSQAGVGDYTDVSIDANDQVFAGGGAGAGNEMEADLSALSGAASMDINEWRRAVAFQKAREHRNRYGSRYRDMLAYLGVSAGDARLDRPERLGGGRQTVSFSEVLSTAATTDADLGALAGHGIAAMRTRPYRRFFPEHGYVLSLMFVRPQTMYINNIPRKFLRSTWDDFWQKELEMMGEQAVRNVELYASAGLAGVFGYVPRHDDYRKEMSYVSGEFRSTLDSWHMGRIFTTTPTLNGSFVAASPTDRIYGDTGVDELQVMANHNLVARRLVAGKARN